MASYDYIAGKKRVKNILDNKLEVIETDKVPVDDKFTFDNGYYCWVSAIFVDIRESTSLFSDKDREKISKIIRSFTSEIIEILRNDENWREIGIRGDCVYAVYTTPQKDDVYEVADKTFYINTYIKMLNKLLVDKKYSAIRVGIGMSTAQELVVKAGRKDVGINSKVWIGEAVTKASNLSALGNKEGHCALVFSDTSYCNFIDKLVERNANAKTWFSEHKWTEYGTYYDANIIKIDFDKWIDDGMKE